MQDIIIVIVIAIIVIAIAFDSVKNNWFHPEKWRKTNNTKTQANHNYDSKEHLDQALLASHKATEEFVEELDNLGYFKYANQDDIDALKRDFFIGHGWADIYDEETYSYKTLRYYVCDAEAIFEQGGIADLLNDFKPVFDKMNFKRDITNHIEEWDPENRWLNYSITINGTEYIIFKHFKERYGWGEAVFRIVQILNIELKKQNIDEQIYLLNDYTENTFVILSNAQYELISSTYDDKPLDIYEWASVVKLDVSNIDYWNID